MRRFEAVAHNTKALGVGRALERFPEIVERLAGMVERFWRGLRLPARRRPRRAALPSQIGAVRVGGIDLNKARMRSVLAAVAALSVAPDGFSVADLAAKVRSTSRRRLHSP